MVYARAFTHDQRGDLARQVAPLVEWATGQGFVRTEVAEGSTQASQAWAILSDPSDTMIVVEHRDRLAHFGVSSSTPRWAESGAGCRSGETVMTWSAT